jgi:hypothetical protein
LYGKQANRIYTDQVNGQDESDGMMNSGKYLNPQSYDILKLPPMTTSPLAEGVPRIY